MLETVYSNENVEADRTNRMQTTFKMPKNIRQIGKSNVNKKIYVEDYVMTFIKQLAVGDFTGCKIAVLLGQCIRIDNCRNIFISGAVEVKNADATGEINFSNDTWTGIYEDIKKYFVDTEIVGWFIGGPSYLLEDEDKILKAHLDNFAGQDKTLLTYDNMEREETFLSYENNRLCKQDGYYIYYEKNEEMQTYMIDNKKDEISSEAAYNDRVSREIRTVLQNKKPVQEESKGVTRLMYAAGTLLAVIVLVVGAAVIGNYDQMNSMQRTLDYLTQNMEGAQEIFAKNHMDNEDNKKQQDTLVEDNDETVDISDGEEGNLNVEVVPGNVDPLEESENKEDKDEDNQEDKDTSDEELAGASSEDSEASTPENNEEQEKDNTKKDAPEETKYYTVVTGDTLAGISFKLYNTYTKVPKIMELNNISNQDLIFVGQKLIVP